MKQLPFLLLALFSIASYSAIGQSKKLNVVVLGAHPDDADNKVGGTAILLAKAGHRVLFVSITNGQAGHHLLKGKELADIRKKEAAEAGKRFGVEYLVLDNPDGELLPSLEVRRQVIKVIREWKADFVIGHRPNDYHPDHRLCSSFDAGCRLYGAGSQRGTRSCSSEEEPGVSLHGRPLPEANAISHRYLCGYFQGI